MKKQLIQALWAVANGQPQQQGEKTVYPSIREQLSAIKMLMSLDDWEEIPPVAAEQEKPIAPAAPCTAEEVSVVAPSAIEVENTSQKTVNIAQHTTNTPQHTTKPTISYRRTYQEWFAQNELLEKLLLEEKAKKTQAKLSKNTKSKNTPLDSSV